MMVKPATRSQVYTAQKSSEPHTAFGVGLPKALTFSSSLLLLSWDSHSSPGSPGKGHQFRCLYSSHPGVGTIWDAGQTDLKGKLPSVWGRRDGKGSDMQQTGWDRKVVYLSPLPCPNPIKASVKQEIFVLLIHQTRGEKEQKTNKPTTKKPPPF